MWPAAVSARLGKPAYGKANDVDQCDEHGQRAPPRPVMVVTNGHEGQPGGRRSQISRARVVLVATISLKVGEVIILGQGHTDDPSHT